jgi:hypothetical protein
MIVAVAIRRFSNRSDKQARAFEPAGIDITVVRLRIAAGAEFSDTKRRLPRPASVSRFACAFAGRAVQKGELPIEPLGSLAHAVHVPVPQPVTGAHTVLCHVSSLEIGRFWMRRGIRRSRYEKTRRSGFLELLAETVSVELPYEE